MTALDRRSIQSSGRQRGRLGTSIVLEHAALLDERICDLPVDDSGSSLLAQLRIKLWRELDLAGLSEFRPSLYFGDEWFSPDGSALISVPFFLAHPLLRRLERRMMGEVEGDSAAERMRLVRHEAGHALIHSYNLTADPQWRRIFGSPRRRYAPDSYIPDPGRTDFVENLPGGYGQSHPEEDFAETFAVWLDPNACWQLRYRRNAKALRKLRYVDRLIRRIAGEEPRPSDNRPMSVAKTLRTRLSRYYSRRLRARVIH